MSNRKKLNQVILLHPNTYYMMLEDKSSSEFINRKLISCLNDESISDFNKWTIIKQELNMFMRRKTKPYKPYVENNKTFLNENGNNYTNQLEPIISKNDQKQDTKTEPSEGFLTSTPKLHIKKKYFKFYDNNNLMENNTIKDFKKSSREEPVENSSKQKNKRRQESPNKEIDEINIENNSSEKPKHKSQNKKTKTDKKVSKSVDRYLYKTRSVQKGESWIKWISLY